MLEIIKTKYKRRERTPVRSVRKYDSKWNIFVQDWSYRGRKHSGLYGNEEDVVGQVN